MSTKPTENTTIARERHRRAQQLTHDHPLFTQVEAALSKALERTHGGPRTAELVKRRTDFSTHQRLLGDVLLHAARDSAPDTLQREAFATMAQEQWFQLKQALADLRKSFPHIARQLPTTEAFAAGWMDFFPDAMEQMDAAIDAPHRDAAPAKPTRSARPPHPLLNPAALTDEQKQYQHLLQKAAVTAMRMSGTYQDILRTHLAGATKGPRTVLVSPNPIEKNLITVPLNPASCHELITLNHAMGNYAAILRLATQIPEMEDTTIDSAFTLLEDAYAELYSVMPNAKSITEFTAARTQLETAALAALETTAEKLKDHPGRDFTLRPKSPEPEKPKSTIIAMAPVVKKDPAAKPQTPETPDARKDRLKSVAYKATTRMHDGEDRQWLDRLKEICAERQGKLYDSGDTSLSQRLQALVRNVDRAAIDLALTARDQYLAGNSMDIQSPLAALADAVNNLGLLFTTRGWDPKPLSRAMIESMELVMEETVRQRLEASDAEHGTTPDKAKAVKTNRDRSRPDNPSMGR